MKPVFMTKPELLEILDEIRDLVQVGDSFEGFINYLMPFEDDDPDGFRVEARYRIGNSQGQGGMRMFGEL